MNLYGKGYAPATGQSYSSQVSSRSHGRLGERQYNLEAFALMAYDWPAREGGAGRRAEYRGQSGATLSQAFGITERERGAMLHRGCFGRIAEDWSKTYEHEGSRIPAHRCGRCGNEILGDAEVELNGGNDG